MKRHLIIFSLILLFISLISCSKREPAFSTNPDGILDESAILKGKVSGVLTLERSAYYRIKGVIEIDSLSTLTIEPGITLFFADSAALIVKGKLVAQGKQGLPVIFTNEQGVSHWKGIQFLNTREPSTLSFTIIENIYISPSGTDNIGAVNVDNSSVTIQNSFIRDNTSPLGGGIFLNNSKAEIKNCIFRYNHAGIYGGALFSANTDLAFINNTVYWNGSDNFGGGLVIMEAGISQVENNIFYKNSGRSGNPGVAFSGDSSKSVIKYNFLGYDVNPPLFISETDYHLRHDSPCINQGDPDSIYNDPDKTRNDQGAYGGPLGNW